MKNIKINIYLIISILFPFVIYFLTFPRENGFADSGLFSAAIIDLGIPLPPGFPTYLIIGHLFTKLPFSLNTNLYLISILASCITLALIFLSIKLLCSKSVNKFTNLAALITTISLAFSYQFWSGTINIEAFPLTITFIFLILFLLLKAREQIINNNYKLSNNVKNLILCISVVLGIGTGLNPIIIFSLAPIFVFALLFKDILMKNKKFLLINILIVLAITISLYLYLPIRAQQNPYLNFGNPTTLNSILNTIIGKGFISKTETAEIIGFTFNTNVLIQSSMHFLKMLFIQFNPFLFILLALGLIKIKKEKYLIFMLLAIFFVSSFLGIFYISGNQEYWFLPAYISLAILSGIGLNYLINKLIFKLKQTRQFTLILVTLIISLLPLFLLFNKLNRSQNNISSLYIENLYSNIDKNSIVIGGGNIFESQTAYAKFINKKRQDIFPLIGNFYYDFDWYRLNIAKSHGIKTSKKIENIIKAKNKNDQSQLLIELINNNTPKTFYLNKAYLSEYASNIFQSCNIDYCKLGNYFLIDNGLTYKVVPKPQKSNYKLLKNQIVYKELFELFPNSQINLVKSMLNIQNPTNSNLNFRINYPQELQLTKNNNSLNLNNPKSGLSISLETMNINQPQDYDQIIMLDKTSYGEIINQGRAEIPNTSFAFVKMFSKNSSDTYLFYLFYGNKLIKAVVNPANTDNLRIFDSIISTLKFP